MVDLAKIYVVMYLKKNGVVASLDKEKGFFGVYKRKTGEKLLEKFAFDGSDEDIQRYAEDVTQHFGGTPATLIEKIKKRMEGARKKVEEKQRSDDTEQEPVSHNEESAQEENNNVVEEPPSETSKESEAKEEKEQSKEKEDVKEVEEVISVSKKRSDSKVLKKMKEQMRKEERDFRRIKAYKEEPEEVKEEKRPPKQEQLPQQQPSLFGGQINWIYIVLGLVFAFGMFMLFKFFTRRQEDRPKVVYEQQVSSSPYVPQTQYIPTQVRSSTAYWREI